MKATTRRGTSFVETVISLVLLAMVATIVLGLGAAARGNMRRTIAYSELKLYALSKIEELQIALETGYEIDAEIYSDTGEESGIQSNVYVENLGLIHGEYLFKVNVEMFHTESKTILNTMTVLRKGCIANAN